MTSIRLAERPASAGMDASRAAEAGLSTPSARPLFNELLNLYHGGDELHGPAFCMDNHRVGATPEPCRPRRGPLLVPWPDRLRTPTAARQEWT